jgi:hypothetical protein
LVRIDLAVRLQCRISLSGLCRLRAAARRDLIRLALTGLNALGTRRFGISAVVYDPVIVFGMLIVGLGRDSIVG